jgi:protein phosphatase
MTREIRFSTESIQGRRPQNEDSVLAETLRKGGLLLAVADGMGGHAAGEVASALALETLLRAVREGEGLEDAIRLANREVHRAAQDPDKLGMGTTITAMLLQNDRILLANVGDSRAYYVSRSEIRQLTEDHSFLAEARKQGQSREDAMATPWKDALTRSIGPDEEVEVDVFGPLQVEEDTALLLCSDGLYKTLGREGIRRVFLASRDHSEAATALVWAAYEGGSDDNITVAIAEFGEFPRRAAGNRSWTTPEVRAEEDAWERTGADAREGDPKPEGVEAIPDEEAVVLGAEKETTWAVWEAEPVVLGPDAERVGHASGVQEPTVSEPSPTPSEAPADSQRKVVGPWDLDRTRHPTLVGGTPPRGRLWRNLLFALAAVVIVAVAAFLYFT